jgi:hypothetical protein
MQACALSEPGIRRYGRMGVAPPDSISTPGNRNGRPGSARPAASTPYGGDVMIHFVHGEALLDVGGEIAGGAIEETGTAVVLHVSVEIPLVGRVKIAHLALDHGHRMVLDVFGEAGLYVRDVITFRAREELGLQMLATLVSGQ